MKRKIGVLAFLLAFLILGQIFWKDVKQKDPSTETPPKDNETEITASLKGVHLVKSQDKSLWEIWAEQGTRYSKKNELHLDKVKGAFFVQPEETLEVIGEKSLVNLDTKDLSMSGNVIARSTHGNIFKTDQIVYSSLHHTLESPTAIEAQLILGDKTIHTIRSSRMSINLKTSRAELQGRVSVKGSTNHNKPFTIKSNKAIWNGSSHSSEFLGSVRIRTDQITISGLKLQLNYSKETGMISNLSMTGTIKARHEDKIVTSKQMHADLKRREFVFTGEPKVIQDQNELRGEKIVFDRKQHSIQVHKAQIKIKKKAKMKKTKKEKFH